MVFLDQKGSNQKKAEALGFIYRGQNGIIEVDTLGRASIIFYPCNKKQTRIILGKKEQNAMNSSPCSPYSQIHQH